MCGIAGVCDPDLGATAPLDPRLSRMLTGLAARGPDDAASARFPGGQIGIRRLAITDPSGGHQPVWSEDGRLCLVMNGEIYNHRPWRERLLSRGHTFQSEGDAEVLVHLYEERGLDALHDLSGMYAFALWDATRGELLLGRDPVGQKPLLVRALPDAVLFASDLRALVRAVPDAGWAVDPNALDLYLTYRAVPGERSMVRGIERVLPGQVVTVREGATMRRETIVRPSRPTVRPDLERSEEGHWIERLEHTLLSSVRRVAKADVPVGMLLSGGLDSALVLALMGEAAQGLPAFVGDWQDGPGSLSEWRQAATLASVMGARAIRVPIAAADMAERLPVLASLLDEPLGDPTALPLFATAQAARAEVRVILTGEGADELFAGYPGYREPLATAPLRPLAASPLGGSAARLARRLGLPGAGALERARVPVARRYLGPGHTFSTAARRALYAPSWTPPDERSEALAHAAANAYPDSMWLNAMRAIDRAVWLTDDALMKLDRVTMAFGLEARAPYLEPDVVALADAMPPHLLISRRQTKRILRQVASRHLPRGHGAVKRGFPVPLTHLVHGPWGNLMRDVVLAEDAALLNVFERSALVAMFRSVSPRAMAARAREIYTLAMLELWMRAIDETGRQASSMPGSEPAGAVRVRDVPAFQGAGCVAARECS